MAKKRPFNLIVFWPFHSIPSDLFCACQTLAFNEKMISNRARFFNTLNNFLTWCAIRPHIVYASRPYLKAQRAFTKSLTGGKVTDVRWKACVMSTNVAFGFALTQPYLDKGLGTFAPYY